MFNCYFNEQNKKTIEDGTVEECPNEVKDNLQLCDKCKKEYWGIETVKHKPSKGLTLEQMQAKLIQMGKEVGKGPLPKDYSAEEALELFR